jgi:hypothetical protein
MVRKQLGRAPDIVRHPDGIKVSKSCLVVGLLNVLWAGWVTIDAYLVISTYRPFKRSHGLSRQRFGHISG